MATRHVPEVERIEVHRPGLVSYGAGLEWQRAAVEAVRGGGTERLAVLEHQPVYTLGARASRAGLRVAEGDLPAPLVVASRGGDVTFHGPGQLVVYPVIDLRARGLRPGDYVRRLEDVVIEALRAFGIEGARWAGRSGVWVRLDGARGAEPAKLAAIGVRVERGVSSHGLALNVTTDLGWYDPIVPCGIADAGVTSIARELGRSGAPTLDAVAGATIEAFARAFDAVVVVPREAKEPVHA